MPTRATARFNSAVVGGLPGVRLHADSDVPTGMGARALTVGRHVAFAPGQFRPGTRQGDALIHHELAHVVQQAGGHGDVQASGLSYDGYETEADAAAEAVRRGGPVSLTPVRGSVQPATVQLNPRDEVRRSSITPEWAAQLSGEELDSTVAMLRQHLIEIGSSAPDYDALSGNLLVLQAEAYRRPLGEQPPVPEVGLVQRPAGLPLEGGYTLVEAEGLPPEIVDALPEGQLVDELPAPGQPAQRAPGARVGDVVGNVVAPSLEIAGGTSGAVLYTSARHLRTYGFAPGGQNAIGLVSFPQVGTSGHRFWQSRLSWGHTAVYVRVDGRIQILRSHAPASLLGTIGTELRSPGAIKGGRLGVPGSFYGQSYLPGRGIPMFTHTGAQSFEVPVARSLALATAEGLPEIGASNLRYTGVPSTANLCQGMNCVRWAVPVAEEALGGRFGPLSAGGTPTSITDIGPRQSPGGAPNQASQGRMYGWMREAGRRGQPVIGWDSRTGAQVVATLADDGRVIVNALPEQASGPPVVGQMSKGMKYLRWGGRVFFVVGIATGGAEILLAEPGQRGRVATEVAAGLGGGMLGGAAAGAAAGLVCGPGAPICSTILAIGGGIIGGFGARSIASWLMDYDREAYRAGVGEYMATLKHKTQGGFTIDRNGEMRWEAPDPRYSAYEGPIRRFETGESGGCQTCHDIQLARHRTIKRYGDPMPEGDLFERYPELSHFPRQPGLFIEPEPRINPLSADELQQIQQYIERLK